MSVIYTPAKPGDGALALVAEVAEKFHPDLVKHGVTVGVLYADSTGGGPAVKLHGYPCAATVRRTPYRERVQGIADAVITVDRAEWRGLEPAQRAALIDHELNHLELAWVVNPDGTRSLAVDDLGRPKLRLRLHDVQAGWFHAVARRHGDASYEVRQAREILDGHGQLYFDFAEGPRRAAAAAVKKGGSA